MDIDEDNSDDGVIDVDLEIISKKRKAEELEASRCSFTGPDIYACFFKALKVDDAANTKKKEHAHLCLCGAVRKQDLKSGYSNLVTHVTKEHQDYVATMTSFLEVREQSKTKGGIFLKI